MGKTKEVKCKSYKHIEKLLNNIFNFYKISYNLDTIFECSFFYISNKIILNSNYIIKSFKYIKIISKNIIITSKKEALIFALLHEIGHSIDYKFNKNKFEFEINNLDEEKYRTNFNYAVKLPLKKRATNFAMNELKRWI